MATEEIEISELEFTEELAPDNLIPVENLTDTKATSLQKLRDWLGIESAILKQVPRGVVFPFGGSVAPDGFLICDGSAISRNTYSELFAVIGTTYGNGDGSTTFNLPNYSSARMTTSATVNIKGNGGAINVKSGNVTDTYLRSRVSNSGNGPGDIYMTSAPSSANQSVYFSTTNGKAGLVGTTSLATSCKFIIKY